jgi:phosphopantetheinyl transferase (holo-ACP synthase)
LPGVGNDVVDLKESDNRGKSGNNRFLGRVFTAEERELIARAAAPDTLLWSLWAAKEAAYKAVSGGDPGGDRSVCSIPRRYSVHLDRKTAAGTGGTAAEAGSLFTGRVITPRGEMALRITVTDDYVHALAAGSDADVAGIIQRVDRMDCGGNPGDPSAFVRGRLLREISRRLKCPLEDLVVRREASGPGAPRVFIRGRPLAADISLSHDGRFAAFALLLREISAVLV